MELTARLLTAADADAASVLVHRSFSGLCAGAWEPSAREVFLAESSPRAMGEALRSPAFAMGVFSEGTMVGIVLMRKPSSVGMLFVHPGCLRQGIGRQLWEQARSHIEASFPGVNTVELNSTPYALAFYRSVGFVPISAQFTIAGCRATRMACWLPARTLGAAL